MRHDFRAAHSRASTQTRGNARGLVARLPRKRDNGRNSTLRALFSRRRDVTAVYHVMALIRRAYISRAFRCDDERGRQKGGESRREEESEPKRKRERERERNFASFEISQARMAGASVATPLARAREHSFFGDEGYRRSLSSEGARACGMKFMRVLYSGT